MNYTIRLLSGLEYPKIFEELLIIVVVGSVTAELKVKPAGFETGFKGFN